MEFSEAAHEEATDARFFGKFIFGVPTGIRTPVAAVKRQCPRPLDDRDALIIEELFL